jgi:hypothetical protein
MTPHSVSTVPPYFLCPPSLLPFPITFANAPVPVSLKPLRRPNQHFHTCLRIGIMFHHAHSGSHASCPFVLPPTVVNCDDFLCDALVLSMGSNSSAFGSGDVVLRLDVDARGNDVRPTVLHSIQQRMKRGVPISHSAPLDFGPTTRGFQPEHRPVAYPKTLVGRDCPEHPFLNVYARYRHVCQRLEILVSPTCFLN